ncbi:MAG TPA: STAS domain-containing protein [Anaerolineae bacterium]|nr:STAS domain-containing protein [Anaerolineae bacterium]
MASQARLQTSLRELPDLAVIDLYGDSDGFAEESLDAAYTRAAERTPGPILLNFARATYINSKGIALLITLLMRAREAGRHLFAAHLSPHYLEIFEITRLSDFFHVVPDEAAAVAAVRELPRGI